MLERIVAAVLDTGRRSRTTVVVGPFAALLDTEDATPWQSIAFPLESDAVCSAGVSAALGGLRRVFADHRRMLRFELFDAVYPRLIAALEHAGIRRKEVQPVMVCRAGELAVQGSGEVRTRPVRAVDPDEHLETFLRVQAAAFGMELGGGEWAAGLPFLRRDLANGRLRCALGLLAGRAVAAASLVGSGAITELAGVGTIPEARRRGAALHLSAALVATHFSGGGEAVWLTAAEAGAQRVYARLGFRDAGGRQVNLEAGAPP